MFDEEDEKLKNLMKLKAEIEKDLEKKGIFREKRETQRRQLLMKQFSRNCGRM